MSDRWQDDAEYQRRKKIDWADTGINIDYAAELGVEAYKRWLAAGGGSITPHPEACATCGGTGVRWQDGAPDECLDCDNFGRAAGGSPTTTPDGKQAFDSPGVLKDAAPTTTPTAPTMTDFMVASDVALEAADHDQIGRDLAATTPTTAQVEAGAAALCEAHGCEDPWEWAGHSEDERYELRQDAEVVLRAAFLVTPTPEEPS